MSDNTNQDDQFGADPTQLTLPRVDTDLRVFGPCTRNDLPLFIPAGLAGVAGVGTFMAGYPTASLVSIPAVGALSFGAMVAKVTTDEWTSPREMVRNKHVHLQRSKVMPWSHDDTVANDVSGVRRFREDGTIEMHDGRVVGAVRISPTNTALMSDSKENSLAAALSSAIDEGIKDDSFRVFATTRPYREDILAEQYRERASEFDDDLQAEYIRDVGAFLEGEDADAWDAREWRYYIVMDATPIDVGVGNDVPSLWDTFNPLTDSNPAADVTTEDVAEEVQSRLDAVCSALADVNGVSAVPVGVREHAEIVMRHWTGREQSPSDGLVEKLTERSEYDHARRDATDSEGFASLHADTTPAENMTNPEVYDADSGLIEIGNEYARVLWVAEFPTAPDAMYLRDLFNQTGLDLDVTLRVVPEDKQQVIADLETDIAQVDAEAMERSEESDVTAMDVEHDIDAYVKMRELLRDTPTQPWRLTAYVTVRGDTVEQVEEDTEAVRDILESAPADCHPVVVGDRQHEAYESASPCGTDAFREVADVEKSTRVLGGAIGAAFPWSAEDVIEPEGMDFGRNEQNGGLIRIDPFDRPGPPHMLTAGQSRSGKTYSASKAAARWYLEGDDRTLIVCDTQSGFDGLTQLLGGKHIVVDGKQQINPLAISPPPEYVSDYAGGQIDQFRMKIDEATQFIVNLLRSQGVTGASEHAPLISHTLEETYADHDIYPNEPASLTNDSPTLGDFVDKLVEMSEAPEEYSFSDAGYEVEVREREIGELLTKLSSFREDGKYKNLVAETGSLLDEDVDMAYLDLQQVDSENDAEKSAMMQLMLSQVYEKVKRADGEVVFLIDEAHFLLHDESMVQWLQKAAREWARYDACMWFLSQSPKDFVTLGTAAGNKDTITEQCSMIHLFSNPLAKKRVFTDGFGLNDKQTWFVQEGATAGKSGQGFSECLINAKGVQGWIQTRVQASPLEDALLSYTPREHGRLEEYLEGHDVPTGGVQ
ncbi:hypothetical protein SAMN04487948_14211 [Halogranum amylolyticum]|uniref:TraC-like domain-containing protein n=1 Tax=Halogranum amylolyticum TaxID=660520 RepID=A0A1H8WTD1_9EURY|nr:hypothetical protein [Halogranum amylolyticum]SEP30964.1 hypothetical protein SAMN04487948_14211 [Halogranum amylolyticum]